MTVGDRGRNRLCMARSGRIRHILGEARWPSAAEAAASRLFSPIAVGRHLTLTERTWVPAMVPWRATPDGEVTGALLDWYGRFAEGQPGAIVVEATGIRDVPSGPLLRIGHDRYLRGLSSLVETVRQRSAGKTRLLIQLIDFLTVRRRPEPPTFFARFLRIGDGHRRRIAALRADARWLHAQDAQVAAELETFDDAELDAVLSARELEDLRFGYRERVGDLHLGPIADLPARLPPLFAEAAARAQNAGFDGIELHYAHAYTMASFLSRTNDRSDGYGGSPAARLRLPLEVYEATRAALDPDTALGCRFLGDEVIAGGSRIEDAVQYAEAFAAAGMDFLSVSKGGKFEDAKQPKVGAAVYPYTGPSGHECMPTIYSDEAGPIARQRPLTRAIRAAVRGAGFDTPVVAAGGINTFEVAEAVLAAGDADIIAAARQSLADPDWWRKMRLGRGAEVRRCKMTNYCEGLDQQHKAVTCQLWDRLGRDGWAEDVLVSVDRKRRLTAPPCSED